jgi:hypothetical protein
MIVDEIRDTLKETSKVQGAMICDFSTFRSIYRLYARAAVRGSANTALIALRVRSADAQSMPPIEVSNQIGACVAGMLRRDDVMTGFDTFQYLLLMGNLSTADGEAVAERLRSRVRKDFGTGIYVETEVHRPEVPEDRAEEKE